MCDEGLATAAGQTGDGRFDFGSIPSLTLTDSVTSLTDCVRLEMDAGTLTFFGGRRPGSMLPVPDTSVKILLRDWYLASADFRQTFINVGAVWCDREARRL